MMITLDQLELMRDGDRLHEPETSYTHITVAGEPGEFRTLVVRVTEHYGRRRWWVDMGSGGGYMAKSARRAMIYVREFRRFSAARARGVSSYEPQSSAEAV